MFTEKLFNKLPKPVYIQPKIEGDRLRTILSKKGISLLSSGGKERSSIPHIKRELKDCGWIGEELDGELYRHGMRHSEIRSIVSRTKNIHPNYKSMEYHIFDCVNEKMPQNVRFLFLSSFFAENNFKYIKLVPTYAVDTLQDLQSYYNQFVAQGYEGIIIRHSSAHYVRRKCVTLLKLKPRVSEYFLIVKCVEEKNKYGVLTGTFGAFVCMTSEGEVFNVGSGPTKAQREYLWKYRHVFEGTMIKVRFQSYTRVRQVPKLLSIDKQWLEEITIK